MKVLDTFMLSFNDFKEDVSLLIHTPHCNLNCQYCFNLPELKQSKFVDFESVLLPNILTYIKQHRFPRHITISGGEATLQHDIVEIITKLKTEHDFKIALYTNGIRSDIIKLILPYLYSIGLDIKIPLDTISDAYDKIFFKDTEIDHISYTRAVKKTISTLLLANFKNIEFRTTLNDKLLNSETFSVALFKYISSVDVLINKLPYKHHPIDYYFQKTIDNENISPEDTKCSIDLEKSIKQITALISAKSYRIKSR